ncbi:MAG: replication-relaxation family protein [Acidithiobacillus sp.]|nr:replication-relaxation family protein [Acidithiobacillus sp.]
MLTYMRYMTKRDALLVWLRVWHFTSASVIAKLLFSETKTPAAQTSAFLYTLAKKGLLRRVQNDQLQGQLVYMLTPFGLDEASEYDYDLGVEYDLTPSSIDHTRIRHDISVQYTVAAFSKRQVISEAIPDRILRVRFPHLRKIPDAALSIEGTGQVAVELEISEKYGRRLEQMMWTMADELAAGRYKVFFVFARVPGIITRYKKALEGPLQRWARDDVSKRWYVTETEHIPEGLQKRITLRALPEISAAISPMTYRRKQKQNETG